MASKPSYGPGWGPVQVTDARLRGWSRVQAGAPTGTTATVESVVRRVGGRGVSKHPVLVVRWRETWPSGEVHEREETLRRPAQAGLWDLEDLAAYLEKANGGPISAERKDALERAALTGLGDDGESSEILSLKGGPRFDALAFLQALDAVEIWRDAESYVVPPWDEGRRLEITTTALRSMLDAAYLAGRRVREAELPADLARSRAAAAAQGRAEAAEAWWSVGAAWAQQLVAQWPKERRRPSLNTLGSEMWKGWDGRPFAPAGPATVEAADLSRRVLPMWKAAGLLRLPTK